MKPVVCSPLVTPAARTNPVSLIECLLLYADQDPEYDAVVNASSTLSYGQLARLVRAQAKEFVAAGISETSVVGISCADDPRHLLYCLAVIYLGATSFSIPAHETDETRNAIIGRCGVTHVVDEDFCVDPLSPDSRVGSRDVAAPAPRARLLFSTSGTTGEPKLVVHQDSDLVQQAHRHIGSRDERFACLASMEHNFARRHRLYCVAQGATNVFVDSEREALVVQCRSLDVNVLHVSAFQAQELLAIADVGRLSGIRLKLGGSHVPLPLRQQLRDCITSNLQAGYGTTETGAIAFTDPGDTNAGESVGQPLPGIEIRTLAPDGNPLRSGETGELAIRGDGMFRGYLGNPELTAARLKDGWFHTGDIGYQDDRQRIHLCGRADDMFLFNSMNIYPQDIEAQICQHPDVIDAAVLPRASPIHGNIPVALVVFADNANADLPALKEFVRERAGIRCPRQFSIVSEIPRNAAGKIARRDAMSLSKSVDQIRGSILQILGSCETVKLKPSLVSAFASGNQDIGLDELEMDSLSRMNLLIALETDYDTVISPREFGRFRTLGDIVSRVVSRPLQREREQGDSPAERVAGGAGIDTDTRPYVVRLFRRIFGCCRTVAHLHQALTTLEHRLTPMEVECLRKWHSGGRLIPPDAAAKFQMAISSWIDAMIRMLRDSGKQAPEPFELQRVAPSVSHCIGPGSPADKTLLVCFASIGSRHLLIPNAALMQHTDSLLYDLLIISEPLNAGYRQGVPLLGNNLTEVIEWISKLDLLGNYGRIRTLGCSAGGYAAVVAGFLLRAEMAVCVGGRFPKKYRIRLGRVLTTLSAVLRGHCPRVLMSYATDNSRDRKFVRTMARLTRASRVAVEITNDLVGHTIFPRLLERGELASYLQRTIFAEMDDELFATERANSILSFPSAQIRSNG